METTTVCLLTENFNIFLYIDHIFNTVFKMVRPSISNKKKRIPTNNGRILVFEYTVQSWSHHFENGDNTL
jgi:hypothetical protein